MITQLQRSMVHYDLQIGDSYIVNCIMIDEWNSYEHKLVYPYLIHHNDKLTAISGNTNRIYRTAMLTPTRILGPIPGKDMQTPSLSFASIFMENAYSAESNEKSMLRFLLFDLWLIVFTIFQKFSDRNINRFSKAAKFKGNMQIALKMIF